MIFDISGLKAVFYDINLIDVFITLTIFYCLIKGLIKGFIRSVAGLIGIIAGFWASMQFHPVIASRLNFFVENQILCFLGAFFLIYLCVYLFFIITGQLLWTILRAIKLSIFDRALGMALGLFKGVIISGIFCFMMTIFLTANSPTIKGSRLYPYLTDVFRVIAMMVPSDIKADFMWKWRQTLDKDSKKMAI